MKPIRQSIKTFALLCTSSALGVGIFLAVLQAEDILGLASGKKKSPPKRPPSLEKLLDSEFNPNNTPAKGQLPQSPVSPALPQAAAPEINQERLNEILSENIPNEPLLEPYNEGICRAHSDSGHWGKLRSVRYYIAANHDDTICLLQIYPKGCDFVTVYAVTYKLDEGINGRSYNFAKTVCEAAEKALIGDTSVLAVGRAINPVHHFYELVNFSLKSTN